MAAGAGEGGDGGDRDVVAEQERRRAGLRIALSLVGFLFLLAATVLLLIAFAVLLLPNAVEALPPEVRYRLAKWMPPLSDFL